MTKTEKREYRIRPVSLSVEVDDRLKEVGKRLVRPDTGSKAGMSAVVEEALNFFFEAHEPYFRKGRSIEQVVKMQKEALPSNTNLIQYKDELVSIRAIMKKEGRSWSWVKARINNGVFKG